MKRITITMSLTTFLLSTQSEQKTAFAVFMSQPTQAETKNYGATQQPITEQPQPQSNVVSQGCAACACWCASMCTAPRETISLTRALIGLFCCRQDCPN